MNAALITAVLLSVLILAGLSVFLRRRARASARTSAAEVDDELRSVFHAEARATLDGLQRDLAQWQRAPAQVERALPLRRGFHTLKGSGLLVGAVALGELSAKIEKVLLRVIERELPPQPEAIDLVARAVAALPGLVADFAAARRSANVGALLAAAERLSTSPRAATRPALSRGR